MTLYEILVESFEVLKGNKLRTILSALGIIIGIGSVIVLVSLGQASQQSVKERITALGTNLLTIRSESPNSQGFLRGASGGGTSLTNDDAKAIAESDRFTTISNVASEYSGSAQISFGENNTNASISGVTLNYFNVRNIDLAGGQLWSNDTDYTKQIVLSSGLAETLFTNGENPLEQKIRLNGDTYKVIGVTSSSSSSFGNSNIGYVPLTLAQKAIFGANHLSAIYVSAIDDTMMDAAENQLGFFLLERHGITDKEKADFSINSQADILETATEITQTFTTLLSGIAAISLLVGGIGIMNIMLVTVTERTKEIGIRKALGAKRRTITTQFIFESLILSVVGGIIGVISGIGISYIITYYMSLPFVISIEYIGIAVGVAVAVGVIFGWYPARRAAKLTPVNALSYE